MWDRLTFLKTFGLVNLLDFSLCSGHKRVCLCGFSLHFPYNQECWALLNVLIGHLSISLCLWSVRSNLCPLFDWIICLFLLICSSLYILDMTLLNICITDTAPSLWLFNFINDIFLMRRNFCSSSIYYLDFFCSSFLYSVKGIVSYPKVAKISYFSL